MNRKFTLIYYDSPFESKFEELCFDLSKFIEEEKKVSQTFTQIKKMAVKSPEIKILQQLG